jgi:hypothetical protein
MYNSQSRVIHTFITFTSNHFYILEISYSSGHLEIHQSDLINSYPCLLKNKQNWFLNSMFLNFFLPQPLPFSVFSDCSSVKLTEFPQMSENLGFLSFCVQLVSLNILSSSPIQDLNHIMAGQYLSNKCDIFSLSIQSRAFVLIAYIGNFSNISFSDP